jgi:hypothetical protein
VLPLLPRWASLAFETGLADLGTFGVVPRHVVPHVARHASATPPVIQWRDPGRPNYYAKELPAQTTYYDAVYLEGRVAGTSPITRLTLDNESLLNPALLRREKTTMFFGYNAALQEGQNCFVVETADKAGNQTTKEVVVTRELPKVQRRDARLKVAVIPLEKKGQSGLAETDYDEILLTALVTQDRFQLVERAQLAAILQEQKLGPLTSPETAVKIGRLAQAEGTLFGSVYAGKTRDNTTLFTVSVRFVDVESSAILLVKDVYDEEPDILAVKELMLGLASKVRESFPRVQGIVLKAEGKKVFVNLGSKEHLKERMKLLVFRCVGGERGQSARTADDCEADTEVLDEALVEEVSETRSRGLLRQGAASVKETDKVITK